MNTQELYQKLQLLLEEHAHANHDVAFYAYLLGIHPDGLSRRLKKAGYGSAKGIISNFIYNRAEQLAAQGLPMGKIAVELGFVDSSYFSRFFKREMARQTSERT